MLTKSYKANYLLAMGLSILLVNLVTKAACHYLGVRLPDALSRWNDFDVSFGLFLILSILIVPFLEGLVFRSIFTPSKHLKLFFYIGVPVVIIWIGQYTFLGLYILLIMFYHLKYAFGTFMFSALLFAVLQFNLNQFDSWLGILSVFSQFAIGLILIWAVVNFGLLRAVLLHGVLKVVMLVPMVLALQFPDGKIHSAGLSGYTIVWNRVPALTSGHAVDLDANYIKGYSVTLDEFCETTGILIDGYDFTATERYSRYDIIISSDPINGNLLDSSTIERLLRESELLRKTPMD